MGLHFHGHGAHHYKAQERDAITREQNAVSPLDRLIADVDKFVLKAEVGVPMKDAKHHLDEEARRFIAAVKHYKDLYNKAGILKQNETPKDDRKVLTTKPKP